MDIRQLTPDDRGRHEVMTGIIVSHLTSPDMLIPMTKEEYEETFAEGSSDVVLGLFNEKDEMTATSGLLGNVSDYAAEPEMAEILTHRCAEIGECMVHPQYRGNGYMLQLNQELERIAINSGIEYLLATAHPDNTASNNSLRKLGMQFLKVFDRHGYIRNIYVKELSSPKQKQESTDYARYCQQQLDDMLESMEDRCFGDMAEGQFVRSH